jgi:hypothetical protein
VLFVADYHGQQVGLGLARQQADNLPIREHVLLLLVYPWPKLPGRRVYEVPRPRRVARAAVVKPEQPVAPPPLLDVLAADVPRSAHAVVVA